MKLKSIPLLLAAVFLLSAIAGIAVGAKITTVEKSTEPSAVSVVSETETALSPAEEELAYGIRLLETRDFQAASRVLRNHYERYVIEEAEASDPSEILISYKALLGSCIANLNLGMYYRTIEDLCECNTYYEELNLSKESLVTAEELRELRLYTILALVHVYVEYEYHETAAAYLHEAETLMEDASENTMSLRLFYAYEAANLSPSEAEPLTALLLEWEETVTEESMAAYLYYHPMMTLHTARCYTITDPEKANEVFRCLMRQGADFGSTPTEKLRLAADIFSAYADYLESSGTETSNLASMDYLKKAAALYEALLIAHHDGVIIDGVYYKQTTEILYRLAVMYAEASQEETALEYLEHADRLLDEITVEAYDTLLNTFALSAKLYEKLGNSERAANALANYRIALEEYPKIMSGHPINLSDISSRNFFPDDQAEDGQTLMVLRHRDNLRQTDTAQIYITEEGRRDPTLVRAVEAISNEIKKITTEKTDALSLIYRYALVNDYMIIHMFTTEVEIVHHDKEILSVLLRTDFFGSGPHEITNYYTFNYDLNNERLIPEAELVSDDMYEQAKTLAEEKIGENLLRKPDMENSEILITEDGLTLIFHPGTIAPYVQGTIIIEIPQD